MFYYLHHFPQKSFLNNHILNKSRGHRLLPYVTSHTSLLTRIVSCTYHIREFPHHSNGNSSDKGEPLLFQQEKVLGTMGTFLHL